MNPEYAIIHHSLTADSGTVSWGAIRKWHTGVHPQSPHKWDDIGYHYGIELVENVYEVLVGRPENIKGAHCPAVNGKSIGICFVGNYDSGPPPDAMLDRAVRVFAPIICRLKIPWGNVRPHSDFDQKSCPGKMFPMEGFIDQMRRHMK